MKTLADNEFGIINRVTLVTPIRKRVANGPVLEYNIWV